MRIVAALGGNALLRRGEQLAVEIQRRNVQRAAAALAPLAREHELVVTHGNGPQVGLLALETGTTPASGPYPLDVLGAESQGMIGYLLSTALRNVLPARQVVTVLSEVVIAEGDPAFQAPSKPVGPVLTRSAADELQRLHGWHVAPESGGFRRVVPSPEPLAMIESSAVAALVAAGFVVIAAGGGGVPLVRRGNAFEGVEAVVDKDLTSLVLALALRADVLLLLTDVAGVLATREDPASIVREATPSSLRAMRLPAGSMGPKAEAAARFVERTGGLAAIGAMEDAADLLAGRAGTCVRRDPVPRLGGFE